MTYLVKDGVPEEASTALSPAEALAFAEHSGRVSVMVYPQVDDAAIEELQQAWGIHEMVVEDIMHAHQRPKLEQYEGVTFLVLRAAHYDDAQETVRFDEFHVIIRSDAIAIICQDGRWIDGTDLSDWEGLVQRGWATPERMMLGEPELLQLGPETVAYRLVDSIVDLYGPVIRGLRIDKEEIETQVFSGEAAVAQRVYLLSREIIETQHALTSLQETVRDLRHSPTWREVSERLQAYMNDVKDHLTRFAGQVAELRDAMGQILTVNSLLVSERQSEQMKKISAWAAILFAPSIVAAIYGMNFAIMPELGWTFGYPWAIGLMVASVLVLYILFKRSKWL